MEAISKAETGFHIWMSLGFKDLKEGQMPAAMDIINIVRCGLPGSALGIISKAFELKKSETYNILHVSPKIGQRLAYKKLDKKISDRLVQLVKVCLRATTVFGDQRKSIGWIKSPCYALGDQVPLQLLDTTEGAELVMNTLGRIEYGGVCVVLV